MYKKKTISLDNDTFDLLLGLAKKLRRNHSSIIVEGIQLMNEKYA